MNGDLPSLIITGILNVTVDHMFRLDGEITEPKLGFAQQALECLSGYIFPWWGTEAVNRGRL